VDVDLTDAERYRAGFPHEVFTALRHEAPVSWHTFPDRPDLLARHDDGFWVVTRYDDVQAVNRDTERFSAFDGPSLVLRPELQGTMLVSLDGPEHTRLRRLISAGFTPRMIGRLEEQVRQWARVVIDRALELGTCDFVAEVAYPLPMHMIADIVGIPLADREWLFTLTNRFLMAAAPDSLMTLDEQLAVQVELFEYALRLGEEKRANPQDDVWTILSTVEVDDGEGGRTSLTRDELDLFFLVLTAAGSETTRNAISLGLATLLEHPDQLERLRAEPAALKPAVEEILRWSSPVSYFARRATRDTEIRGVPIAEGDRVTLWYPSANRDEDVFDDPFRFDIGRTPNHHVAFGGGGPHYCLGANLARREITVLFEELLARVDRIEPAGPARYVPLGIYNPILLALGELPVHLS